MYITDCQQKSSFSFKKSYVYVLTQYLFTWDAKNYTEQKKNSMNKLESECNVIISDTEKKSSPSACRGIYGLQNKLSPDKWYVGQSWNIKGRWNKYKKLRCKNQPKLYNALLKYGYDGFEKVIIEMCDINITQEMLDLKEAAWIKHFNAIKHGYNCKDGGANGKATVETRAKMSASSKGKRKSDEMRKNLSIALTGKKRAPFSDEALKNMSLAQKGKKMPPLTDEVRENMSRGQKGKKLPPWTDEHRKNASMAQKKRPPFSETHRKNLSESAIKRCAQPKISKSSV